MTDKLMKRFSLIGVVALGLSLQACAHGEFTDEGASELPAADEGNMAKSILIAMGAIEDPHPPAGPKFQPRPPLVVPPQRSLPAPVDEDAMLANKRFPVDPEKRAADERAAKLKAANAEGDTNKVLTVEEQARYKDLPVGAPGPHVDDRDASRPLKPWELDGTAQAKALEAATSSGGPRAKQQSLLAPPEDYRTPSPKAPLESPPTGLAAMKPSWWPF